MNIPLAHPQLSEAASKFLAGKHQAFIGGKWVDAVSGKTFDTFDPGDRAGDRASRRVRRARYR